MAPARGPEQVATRSTRLAWAGRLLACTAVFAWLLASTRAEAAVPEEEHQTWRLQLGLDYSDNRLRSELRPQGDWQFVPGLDFSVLRRSERLQTRGSGIVQFEQSLLGVSDQRLRARMALTLDWVLLPQRLYWTVQDVADVQAIDLLAADGPDNLQQTNVFLTGPVLLLGHPRSVLGRIEGRVARAYAEKSPAFDHDRFALSAWLQRRSTPIRTYALGAESSSVDFRQRRAGTDFQRNDVMLRYDHELPRAGLQLLAGYTWIDRDNSEPLSRALLRGRLRWTPNVSHEFRAEWISELSDAGRDQAATLDAGERIQQETRRALIGPDLYHLRSRDLQWRHRGRVSELFLGAFSRDFTYQSEASGLERRSHGGRASASRALSPLLSAHVQAFAAWYEFDTLGRRDRDRQLALYLERQMSLRWSLRAGIARFIRDSNIAGFSYRENSVSVQLIYTGGK